MNNFNQNELKSLSDRGFKINKSPYELNISMTTLGVAWLFNFLHESSLIGSKLSLKTFKDLANYRPLDLRDLRLKASKLSAYENQEYLNLVCYLNGTPPRAFHSFPPKTNSITSLFNIPPQKDGAFNARGGILITIEFSDSEIARLNSEKTVIVSCADK